MLHYELLLGHLNTKLWFFDKGVDYEFDWGGDLSLHQASDFRAEEFTLFYDYYNISYNYNKFTCTVSLLNVLLF